MKSRVLVLFIIIIHFGFDLEGQNILTLRECYEGAALTTAIAGEKEAYNAIWQKKDENISKNWLPGLDAVGNILYNSSVIDMKEALGELPIPNIAEMIKPLPHEQYKLTLEISQTIYDGGAVKNARTLEKTGLHLNEKQTETDLYKLRSQINSFYFSLLVLTSQKKLLDNFLELITKRIASLQSAVENGVVPPYDLDVMASEKLMLEQQIKENGIIKNALAKVLSDLTGIEITPFTELVPPVLPVQNAPNLNRPELEIFDLKKEQLAASLKVIDSKRMPKAFGFATLGYGNPPGNNFFRDEFAPYYMVGAGIRWNVFDWDKAKNERQIISLQQGIIDNRKNELTDNLIRLLEAKSAEILSLQSLVTSDEELVRLRKKITAAAESRYNNGTITATELLSEINAEKQALINCEIHKINLAMARVEYLNISGQDL